MPDAFIASIYLTSKTGTSQGINESWIVINKLQYFVGERGSYPHAPGMCPDLPFSHVPRKTPSNLSFSEERRSIRLETK